MPPAHPWEKDLHQYTVDHIVRAVSETAFEEAPFPHFIANRFFPWDVYAKLLKCLPAEEHYEAFGYEKHANKDGASNRKRFSFDNAWLDRLSAEHRRFWYSVRSALGSIEVKEAVFGKLAAGLAFRFGCAPGDAARTIPGYALPELFRETEGYRIAPHPDTRRKVVTLQISLAVNNEQRELGTEFYRRSLSPLSWLREPRGFDIVKVTPFLPNTAYAFVVLNTRRLKSWHGRSQLSSGCGVRNSILNIWYAKPEDANKDLVEEQHLLAKAA